MRAGTYVRLSASRMGEEAPGLDRQRAATERLVRERGWDLAATYRDADVSAFRGVARPGFADLEAAVGAGEVDVVVTWKLDRLFRRLKEAVDFLDLCRSRNVHLVSVAEGVDTSTAYGAMLFALFTSLGEIESQTKTDRITAWHAQRAKQGLPSGGGSRPFGFRDDRVRHDPAEVQLIRKAARNLLDGKTSLRGVARAWSDSGIPTPTGRGRWTTTTVRRLLLSPRIAGLREHGGKAYPAKWKPILTPEERLGLLARLDGRSGERRGRRYLLTGGVAVCGLCGVRLVARPKDGGRRAYTCASDQGGCGKVRALAAPLEEFVAEEVNRAYEAREIANPTARRDDADELRRQVDADTASLEELARERFVTRSIGDAEFRAAREPLVERIADGQDALSRLGSGSRRSFLLHPEDLPPAPWEVPDGEDPDPTEFEEWRRWVTEFVERVTVGPAVRGRNFFSPDRVAITWREEAVEAVS